MKNYSFRNDVLPLKNILFRLAMRITLDSAEAEDVVQETMIKVWNKREDWHNIDSMEALCMTICRNLAIDKTRRMANNNQSLDDDSGPEHADRTYNAKPEEQAMQHDRLQIVRDLINKLPEKQRTVIQLRDFEGKTYKEIALIMNVSEEQVKVNLFRARQTIKQRYSEKENYGL